MQVTHISFDSCYCSYYTSASHFTTHLHPSFSFHVVSCLINVISIVTDAWSSSNWSIQESCCTLYTLMEDPRADSHCYKYKLLQQEVTIF